MQKLNLVAILLAALLFLVIESSNVTKSPHAYFATLVKTAKKPVVKTTKAWQSKNSPRQKKRTRFYDNLFRNYDKRLLPSYKMVIQSSIFLSSLDSISELSFSYDMGMFLRLRWHDPRLSFDPKDSDAEKIVNIDALMYELLWVPDLFIANEKKASFHEIVTPNRLITLSRDGTVMYSSRYYFTLFCQMNLRAFPFDNQFCNFQLQSYAYPDSRMILHWSDVPLEVPPNLSLAQFSLNSIDFESATVETPRGNYSSLIVTFHFIRHLGFYIIQIYVPSFLTVLTAMTAFWIEPLAVPGRVTISVFTTLIMANMSWSFRATLPTVSYIKAIDIWILACTLFVFIALVEYALVNVLVRQKPLLAQTYHTSTIVYGSTNVTAELSLPSTPIIPSSRVSLSEDNENIVTPKSPLGIRSFKSMRRRRLSLFQRPSRSSTMEQSIDMSAAMSNRTFLQSHRNIARVLRCLFPNLEVDVPLKHLSGIERCEMLEAFCRRIFPFGFFLFNVVYWSTAFFMFRVYYDNAGEVARMQQGSSSHITMIED